MRSAGTTIADLSHQVEDGMVTSPGLPEPVSGTVEAGGDVLEAVAEDLA